MKQRTKRTWVACLAALWLILPAAMQAQVHIGGNTDAIKGALLDLTTPEGSNLGLLPLNVSIGNINQIPDAFTNKASIIAGDLQGLIVYNTNGELADGAGLYVWDGAQWHFINAAVPVTGVTVSPTSKAFTTLTTQQLTATVAPTTAANKAVTWESSNTAVATVNASGLVTAVGNGSATITVTTADGNKTATCDVTVAVAVTGVTVNPTSKAFTTLTTQQLTATVLPATAANKAVTWKSSNTAVATVNASGLVTAVGNGSATITVTTTDGSKTATCDVTVAVAVTGVTVDPTSATLRVGATKQLTETVAPTTAANKAVTWQSNNTGVATVSTSGLVTALAIGSATITVTTTDGAKTASSTITVQAALSSTQSIYIGSTRYYYAGDMPGLDCTPVANRPPAANGYATGITDPGIFCWGSASESAIHQWTKASGTAYNYTASKYGNTNSVAPCYLSE
ncbi:MAG: Ig-like domain-containing protein [Candidatus Symbiothrix sp.]|nr:Ig-like domain-containing protein [Candidatus Symbiothrix sp.]